MIIFEAGFIAVAIMISYYFAKRRCLLNDRDVLRNVIYLLAGMDLGILTVMWEG
jgi:hypothetical protein